jgi:hypothetical protein
MTEQVMTQKEAAAAAKVSAGYLRNSDCPKLLLPGQGRSQKPVVRYLRSDVEAWLANHRVAPLMPTRRSA